MSRVTLSMGDLRVTFEANPADALSVLASSLGYQDVEVEPDVTGTFHVTAGNLCVRGGSLSEACEKMAKRMVEEKKNG